jgi:hypothetical protein
VAVFFCEYGNFASCYKDACVKYLRFILVIILFLEVIALPAQYGKLYNIVKSDSMPERDNMGRIERYLYDMEDDIMVEGSMYLDDEFKPGILILKNGVIFRDLFFRYNAFDDKMQMIQGVDTLSLVKPEEVKFLKIGDRTFIYDDFTKTDSVHPSFFQLLSDGNYKLLVRHFVVFRFSNPFYLDMHIGDECDRFIKMNAYYVQEGSSPAIRIRKSIKSLQSAFPQKKERIRQICNERDLNIRKETDLIRLFETLNK